MDNLVKVELGCGRTKNEGYIGIDRFSLPGVDIVADLDQGIPMEDDSVDVIFACHSLEHFSDLRHIMSEIYRICKDGAIIHILSPYYNTATNLANIYHKQVFNEDTFRFFCRNEDNPFIEKEEWYCPHALSWGLSPSDNSKTSLNFIQIGIEYFYYKEYRHLGQSKKLHARRALSNVCDQLLYTLIADKSGNFSTEHLLELKEQAAVLEPPIIAALRERDKVYDDSPSIITDIQQLVWEKVKPYQENLQSEMQRLSSDLCTHQAQSNQIYEEHSHHIDQLEAGTEMIQQQVSVLTTNDRSLQNQIDELKILPQQLSLLNENSSSLQKQIDELKIVSRQISVLNDKSKNLQRQIQTLKEANEKYQFEIAQLIQINQNQQAQINRNIAFTFNLLDLSHKHKQQKKYFLWSNPEDLYFALKAVQQNFIDGLILHACAYRKKSRLCASALIPSTGYIEYLVKGYGDRVNVFLIGATGTKLFVELVVDGAICHQQVISLDYQGIYSFPHPVTKCVSIRMKQLSDVGMARTIEIANRRLCILERRTLAAYLE